MATWNQVARVNRLWEKEWRKDGLPVPGANSGSAHGQVANTDEGKQIYSTYDEAEAAAKNMRAKLNRNFSVYKTDNGWAVGGVHVKAKRPYKRVKTFSDLKSLFDDLVDPVEDADVEQYADLIQGESKANKESTLNGESEGWILKSFALRSGRDLSMNNDRQYLVLRVANDSEELELLMGGAFSPSIPLISRQAQSLIGKPIVWHTWNSRAKPGTWSRTKWFYMIEQA